MTRSRARRPPASRCTVSLKLPTPRNSRRTMNDFGAGTSPRSVKSKSITISDRSIPHTPSNVSYQRTRMTLRLRSPVGTYSMSFSPGRRPNAATDDRGSR